MGLIYVIAVASDYDVDQNLLTILYVTEGFAIAIFVIQIFLTYRGLKTSNVSIFTCLMIFAGIMLALNIVGLIINASNG